MTSEGWIVMIPLVHSPGWLTSCVTVGSGDFVKLRRHQGQAADSRRFCLEEKGSEAVREQQALAPEPLFLLVGG